MIRRNLIAALIAAASPAALWAQDSATQADDFDLARKNVIDCAGEKFVFAWGAGGSPTKVTLCSKEGATPEDLVVMLDDAAEKLAQAVAIPEDRRDALIQQIRAKIAEVKARSAQASRPVAVGGLSPRSDPQVAAPAEIAALPPLPAPAANPPASIASRPPVAARPNLSLECSEMRGGSGGGPCDTVTPETTFIVTARAPVSPPVALRFLRRGEERAEVSLGAMTRGQTRRLPLPAAVCAGVYSSKVTVDIVHNGRVAESIGPFLLRC